MLGSFFKHGYWAASRGCKAKEPQGYPYCSRPKPWYILLITSLSLERAFCNILDVQKRNASFEHIWYPFWGSVLLLGCHIWIGRFLNIATALPPGDCQAKKPQRYPYCFWPKPWPIFLITSLSLERAFCNILGSQKGDSSFEHIFNPCWGSVVLLGRHLWIGWKRMLGMFFKHSYWAASRGLPSQEATTISILFLAKTMTNFFDHISFIRESLL